ncbi:sce7725 family protein [Fluviicola taffensis]|uniref:sce7725 family protein n=1 Tax=Fluviicola taffensis TaxID=191579 RepID=UPI003137A912
MYFPFLRGKQFELIALREMCDFMSSNKTKVSPIIEPVKDSSTLKSTLRALAIRDVNFNVVINPRVGDLQDETELIIKLLEETLSGYNNFQPAIIITQNNRPTVILDLLKKSKLKFQGITFMHYSTRDGIAESLKDVSDDFTIVNNVIHLDKTGKRYYREFDLTTRVSLGDYFDMKDKNADYLEVDSFFSDEHLYFKDEGYKGFSDFLTIGEDYSEAGFLPRAVAIHLSYIASDNKIRVKHFVSDSNEDTSDIGGKFEEALGKLILWVNSKNIDSLAIRSFKELGESGHFPGLGTLKKLSAMNHIEMSVNSFK